MLVSAASSIAYDVFVRGEGPAVEDNVTFTVAFVRHLVATAAELGINEHDLLRECQIDPGQLADPLGRVPAIAFNKLWRRIAGGVGSESLAAAAADRFRPPALGIAGILAASAPCIGAMRPVFDRYGSLVGAAYQVPLLENLPGARTRFSFTFPPELARHREQAETGTLTVLTVIRRVTGFDGNPVEVSFQFPRPRTLDCYEHWFDAPIRFNAPDTSITLPIGFSQPLLTSAPEVSAYLARYADILLQQSRRPMGIAARVQEALCNALRTGGGSATQISRMLHISERTLQRYLRSEDTSFAEVLQKTRRDLAFVHLEEAQLSVHEIALILGYSNPRPFTRAFRAWTGMTPSAYRRTHSRLASV